jgi:deoxyribodipyrimidine photolyase-related protein
MARTLRLLLGDQLNINHSWFNEAPDDIDYLMIEVASEATYVSHHIVKITSFFLAMRLFASELRKRGFSVIYIALDNEKSQGTFHNTIHSVLRKGSYERFEYLEPDEFRLDRHLKEFAKSLSIPSGVMSSEHFLEERTSVADFFRGKKQFLLESYYRHLRLQHDILLDDKKKPEGGMWNFDKENRSKFSPSTVIPKRLTFNYEVDNIVSMLHAQSVPTIGRCEEKSFFPPLSRDDALLALSYFCSSCLQHFGTYQDAMTLRDPFLFHSLLSFPLNVKLLSPREVIDAAIKEWTLRPSEISISQIEGFVRQILGWREYMRGIYWAKMPDYATLNFFGARTSLPHYFWDGVTAMKCMSDSLHSSLSHSYAHHIQRLMILGNFALLAGIDPTEVDSWYLGVYVDAIEWVQLPNTRGMSQFADGGIVATKPYVASSNYIHKMSDYCSKCSYNRSLKYGDKACPFNSLYWDFFSRNRDKLERNPRIGMAYVTLDRMNSKEREAILSQAKHYLAHLEAL